MSRGPKNLAGVYGLDAGYVATVEAYTSWLVTRGYAASTVETYRGAAARACRFLQNEGVASIGGLRAEHVAAYAEELAAATSAVTGRGLSSATIAGRLLACASLDAYRVAVLGLGPEVRALPQVEGAAARGRVALNEAEVRRLYAAADELDAVSGGYGGRAAYARAVLALCYGCGLRVSEARALRCDEVDVDGGRLLVARAKNYHARYVPLSEGVRRDLGAWLGESGDGSGGARARYAEPTDCECVLVNRWGRPCGVNLVNRGLHTLCEAAGVRRISAHVLRHSIATQLVLRGMDLEAVARFLGHRSLESTLIYVRVAEEMAERDEVVEREEMAQGEES